MLIGGGVGVGLLLAWELWPRSYESNLRAAPGETIFSAFLKIALDGRVIVAVPQAELGQGVYTSLPQILADELGADWRTVSVEPAPINPLYANRLLAEEISGGDLPSALQGVGRWAARRAATRDALMITGGSTSVRAFEAPLREAGARRARLADAGGGRALERRLGRPRHQRRLRRRRRQTAELRRARRRGRALRPARHAALPQRTPRTG